jgi:hypothetical protein
MRSNAKKKQRIASTVFHARGGDLSFFTSACALTGARFSKLNACSIIFLDAG